MPEMKTTRPDFPHAEVLKKILQVIEPYTNDSRDVAALATTLATYALRFGENSRGKKLERQEFINWCLNAFVNTNDETAKAILTGAIRS